MGETFPLGPRKRGVYRNNVFTKGAAERKHPILNRCILGTRCLILLSCL